MVGVGEMGQALMGIGQDHLRGVKALSGGQGPGELLVVDAHDRPDGAHLIHLNVGTVVAGIDQHHAIALALVLCGGGVTENDKRIVVVAGGAPLGGDGLNGAGKRNPLHLPLHGMAAMKVDEIPLTKGQVETDGSRLLQTHGAVTGVDQPGRPGDHILLGKDAIEQMQLQTVHRVRQVDDQRFCLVLSVKNRGHSCNGILSRQDLVAGIVKIGSIGPVSIGNLQAAQPEITGIEAGILLGQQVERGGSLMAHGIGIRRKTAVTGDILIGQTIARRFSAVVKMEQVSQHIHLHLIGGVLGGECKGVVSRFKVDAHC